MFMEHYYTLENHLFGVNHLFSQVWPGRLRTLEDSALVS